MLKYLQTGVIYFFTDTEQAVYSTDGTGLIYFDELDEAQTETGITTVIQTTEKEFENTYTLLADVWDKGADFVVRHPGMSAEYIREGNPYRRAKFRRNSATEQ